MAGGHTPLISSPSSLWLRNAPNPARQATLIEYQLPAMGAVRLNVYNIAGQLIKSLVDARQLAGMHGVRWDSRGDNGQKVSAGVYLCRLQAGDTSVTRKLVLVR